jgi:hypothetical protein
VLGVVRPLLWWVLLSLSLWIGRKILSDRVGRAVFEHYWDSKKFRRPRFTAPVESGSAPDWPIKAPMRDASGLPSKPFDK